MLSESRPSTPRVGGKRALCDPKNLSLLNCGCAPEMTSSSPQASWWFVKSGRNRGPTGELTEVTSTQGRLKVQLSSQRTPHSLRCGPPRAKETEASGIASALLERGWGQGADSREIHGYSAAVCLLPCGRDSEELMTVYETSILKHFL